jgi:hypothetical protein
MSNLSEIIFAQSDIAEELIHVDAWGVDILVKAMTARDRARMVEQAGGGEASMNLEQILPDLVILCSYDPESGERIFMPSDRDALLAKSADPIEKIALKAMALSGMSEDAVDAAGKDSSPTLTADSSLN